MELPARGEVVIVLFPSSTRGASKPRPALVLTSEGLGPKKSDFLVASITTQVEDPLSIPILPADFITGGLQTTSYVRPSYLYAASTEILGATIGKVQSQYIQRVVEAIKQLLDGSR